MFKNVRNGINVHIEIKIKSFSFFIFGKIYGARVVIIYRKIYPCNKVIISREYSKDEWFYEARSETRIRGNKAVAKNMERRI